MSKKCITKYRKVQMLHNLTYQSRRVVFLLKFVYLFVAGSGNRTGKILQRFPEKDWSDTPFIEGIEWVRFVRRLI